MSRLSMKWYWKSFMRKSRMNKKGAGGTCREKERTTRRLAVMALAAALLLGGCAAEEKPKQSGSSQELSAAGEGELPQGGQASGRETTGKDGGGESTGISHESAKDAEVDFAALVQENPDIFAWLYIPDTEIDHPVLQSQEADDYYENHNACGEPDEEGAFYTELANLKNMCDFNTVIHGKEPLARDWRLFSDPEFFDSHQEIFLYLEDNLLTYTVFAAFERENTSLIRSYDFTWGSGCEQFLRDIYGLRDMGKLIREGWEEVTPSHFLLTLTMPGGDDPEKQFVVIAALTGDAAGKIDRTVEW